MPLNVTEEIILVANYFTIPLKSWLEIQLKSDVKAASRSRKHFFRVCQRLLCDADPSQHAGYFMLALIGRKFSHLGLCTCLVNGFFNQKMLMPKCCDLVQMGDAEYLAVFS